MEIITASYALPMTNGCPVVPEGAIAVELGRIHEFGTSQELRSHYPDADVKSYQGCVLMPGLVNAHCHLDLVPFYESIKLPGAGQEPVADFVDALVASIDFKHDAKPETLITGIRKGIERLTETGVTCVGDMTNFEGTFSLLREAGLRAVIFPEVLAGRGEAAQVRFEIALALVEKHTDATHDRIRVGLGPYAPYLLSRNLLKIIARHAREASIPLMIHAAESFAEMEFFFDSQGPLATDVWPALGWGDLPPAQRKTPVEYLAEIGFFDAPTIIVGGMHLSAKDFPALARHLVRIAWCPTANKVMRHGTFSFGKLSGHGIPMGLGTDIWIANHGFNLWEEMRLATQESSQPPTPPETLRMATIGGARVLGLDHLIGTLEEGKKADCIVVEVGTRAGDGCEEAIYGTLIADTEPHHVKKVLVSGNILKST